MGKSRVEFRTIDGVVLRGDFHQAEGADRAIVVMTAGFPLLKEHYASALAERFASSGISALAFDYRNWGSSDGTPRNESDLYRQGSDYRDAVTAAARLPGVDPRKVILWGFGHAGAAAIIAAADDPRIAGLILLSPAISGRRDASIFGDEVIGRAWASRERRTTTGDAAAAYIKPWADSLEEARDPGAEILFKGEGPFRFISEALVASRAAGTPWRNELSLQSILNVVGTEARDFLHKVEAPTLYAAFPEDPFTGTAAFHRAAFETMGERAEFTVVEPTGGPAMTDVLLSTMGVQIQFVARTVG